MGSPLDWDIRVSRCESREGKEGKRGEGRAFETEAEAGAPLLSEHPKPRVVSLEGDVEERKRGEAADGGRAGAVIRSH